LKEFIKSYIETYQSSLNTTNPNFLFHLVRPSTEMQDFNITAFMSNTNKTNEVGNGGDKERDEKELKIQQFKEMLSGFNNLDSTIEMSKQVKIHKFLTQCYFDFIREIIKDFVPKRIYQKMVKLVLDNFEHELNFKVLITYIIKQSFDEVFLEKEQTLKERKRVEQMLFAVNTAIKNMIDLQCFT